jgi:FtsH-binding integral membrane protein
MTPSYISASRTPSTVLVGKGVAQVYWLFTFAMALTLLGVFAGATFALPIIASGWVFLLLLVEIFLVVTARAWVRSSPLNIILFAVFPLVSGLTITPFLMSVLVQYVNGATILLNAAIATTLLSASSAVSATMLSSDLGGVVGRFLFNSLIGLVFFGILQIFFPALRGPGFEMILSGVGIVTFSMFLAYDIQRLRRSASFGESPFMLALSLYLDIFNLFIYVLRFMLVISGRRR